MTSSQWLMHCSLRIYRFLLLAYPPEFRQRYSHEMTQTFRDCCREELQSGGKNRLFQFCGLVLCDLLKSISIEHAAKLKRLFGLQKGESLLDGLYTLSFAELTDIGHKRKSNEDNMISVLPEDASILSKKGALFVVADGMGDHSRGEVASDIAVHAIRDAYYQDANEDTLSALQDAVKHANLLIYRENESQLQAKGELTNGGMGTTCVAAVLKGDRVYIANAGDSLAYLVRDEEVKQLAESHCWVDEQVRKGIMTEQEALTHYGRNVIYRSLGELADVEVYLASYTIQQGDTLVLCTDGLHELVSENEIRTTVERYEPEESARRLIERANAKGGPDNITAVVVHVTGERIAA
jgi:PPM family protein phosphatase